MPGLIIAATSLEIKPLISKIQNNKYWKIIITGVGPVNTAYHVMKAVHQYNPIIMVQLGIAGCFDKKVPLGSLFSVSSDHFGDMGVVEKGVRKNIFDLRFASPNSYPFKKGLLQNPNKALIKKCKLPAVNAVTNNVITTSKKDIIYYKEKSGAILESMEGAAFHYVALMEKIPFIQIRSISNYVGERNKVKWKMQEAIDNLYHSFIQTKILETIK